MYRRFAGVAFMGLLGFALTSCSSSSGTKPTSAGATSGSSTSGTVVRLKLLQFVPAKLTVKVGTTVTWRNDEDITHTVTSGTYAGTNGPSGLRTSEKPNGLFNATLAKKGATTTYTFSRAGTFPYYCAIHKAMNATVVVTP